LIVKKKNSEGNEIILELSGYIDTIASDELKDMLYSLDVKENQEIILELSDVDFIGSTAIGRILLFYKKVKDKNVNIVFQNPNEDIKKLFSVIGLDQLFIIK